MAEDQVVEGQNQPADQAVETPGRPIDLDGILEAFRASGNYFHERMNEAQRVELEGDMIQMLLDFNLRQRRRVHIDHDDVIPADAPDNQTALWYKCSDGTIVTDRRLCPGGGAIKLAEPE